MLGMKYDRDVWNNINVERMKEYDISLWMHGFGIYDREQGYLKAKSQPKNEKSMQMAMWEQE